MYKQTLIYKRILNVYLFYITHYKSISHTNTDNLQKKPKTPYRIFIDVLYHKLKHFRSTSRQCLNIMKILFEMKFSQNSYIVYRP